MGGNKIKKPHFVVFALVLVLALVWWILLYSLGYFPGIVKPFKAGVAVDAGCAGGVGIVYINNTGTLPLDIRHGYDATYSRGGYRSEAGFDPYSLIYSPEDGILKPKEIGDVKDPNCGDDGICIYTVTIMGKAETVEANC